MISELTAALAAQARKDIAKAHSEAAARPIGEIRLDIGFYSAKDRKLPVEDYDFTDASGRRFKGQGSRWAVWMVRWTGSGWRNVRKLSGPLKFTPALDRLIEECQSRGLERVK